MNAKKRNSRVIAAFAFYVNLRKWLDSILYGLLGCFHVRYLLIGAQLKLCSSEVCSVLAFASSWCGMAPYILCLETTKCTVETSVSLEVGQIAGKRSIESRAEAPPPSPPLLPPLLSPLLSPLLRPSLRLRLLWLASLPFSCWINTQRNYPHTPFIDLHFNIGLIMGLLLYW